MPRVIDFVEEATTPPGEAPPPWLAGGFDAALNAPMARRLRDALADDLTRQKLTGSPTSRWFWQNEPNFI
jgi:hypothetical protein